MFNIDAYKEWKDLFDGNVSNVWQNESIPVLKKLSMVVFSLKREIKKIEEEVDNKVLNLRKNVEQAENKQNEIVESAPLSNNDNISDNNKENIQVSKIVTRVSPKTLSYNTTTIDSPEMFRSVEAILSESTNSKNDSDSILISDDEKSTLQSESPEIKKKKRNYFSQKRLHRGQRLRDSNSPTVSFLRGLSSLQKDDSIAKQSEKKIEESRDGEEKSSMDFLKDLLAHTQKSETSIQPRLKQSVIPTTTNQAIEKSSGEALVLTPSKKVCDVDMSVVQCTPVPISVSKRKDNALYLSKKSKKEKNRTLTQMFSKNRKLREFKKKCKIEENYDSDETHFEPTHGNRKIESDSIMSFTRMVSYMNPGSTVKEKNTTKEKTHDEKSDPNTEDILKIMEDVNYGDFEDNNDNTLNSAIIEEDDKHVEVPEKLNEFLAKAQNVPNQLEAAPIVRGKARQNLPGWACNDCERFYLNQGLNPEQILALNKCSKHRGQYRPREDTLPGFWDMNMSTQETQNKQN